MLAMYLPIAGVEFSVAVLVALGFAVGVLAGFFGMGGGWVVTPALNILGLPMPIAIGTELANIAGQSALAGVKHRKMGNVDYPLGITVGVAMVLGVEGGARTVMWLDSIGLAGSVVRWVYTIFLTCLGAVMMAEYFVGIRRRSLGGGGGRIEGPAAVGRRGLVARFGVLRVPPLLTVRSCGVEVSVWVLAACGLLVGCLAGVMGAGGGVALVPLFVYVLGTPTYVAVGTSLVCVLISGAYGAFTYALQGKVEVVAALWMLAGAAVGAQLGSAAIRYVRGARVRLLYAVMLLLAAGGVLMKQFGLPILAGVAIFGGALAMCLILIGLTAYGMAESAREG